MTAVVAFTFGSLGDIISLLQIANGVRKALCDTKGVSAEYRDLLAELDTLVYTIASAQRTLSVHGPNHLSQSVENGLYHAVQVCLRLLTQANERISVCRKAVAKDGGSKTSDLWGRVGWMLLRKDELIALRLRLSEQIKAMDTLLTLAQGDHLKQVADQVDRTKDQLDCVQLAAREQYALVVEIHRCVKKLPQQLGYFWEGDPGQDSLPVELIYNNRCVTTLPSEFSATQECILKFAHFHLSSFHAQNYKDGYFMPEAEYIENVDSRFRGLTMEEIKRDTDVKPKSTLHCFSPQYTHPYLKTLCDDVIQAEHRGLYLLAYNYLLEEHRARKHELQYTSCYEYGHLTMLAWLHNYGGL